MGGDVKAFTIDDLRLKDLRIIGSNRKSSITNYLVCPNTGYRLGLKRRRARLSSERARSATTSCALPGSASTNHPYSRSRASAKVFIEVMFGRLPFAGWSGLATR
jgi:hypothetical protein